MERKNKKQNEEVKDPAGTMYIESDEPAGGSPAIRGFEGTSPQLTNEESEGAINQSDVVSEEDKEWRDEPDYKEQNK